MRLFVGMILGIFLTIGFAYLYDTSTANSSEPTVRAGIEHKPMVNWDVVSGNWQGWSSGVRATWNRLAAR